MKVYLDDERMAPEGWIRCFAPADVIALLQTGFVDQVSLDHDLGDDDNGTGYDVLLWIEEAVALRGFIPPRITVHSANPSARQKMALAVTKIEDLIRERKQYVDRNDLGASRNP